jgi:hypothetical protein
MYDSARSKRELEGEGKGVGSAGRRSRPHHGRGADRAAAVEECEQVALVGRVALDMASWQRSQISR